MERLSIFDIYKIGVGPSSSHTLGPWKAALDFVQLLKDQTVDRLEVHLYGSLAKTGKGHATDIAVQLGLSEFQPETIATDRINHYIQEIVETQQLRIHGQVVAFHPEKDIIFHHHVPPAHPNTLRFKAFTNTKEQLAQTYYSIGGGFIQRAGEDVTTSSTVKLPFPIDQGRDVLNYTEQTGQSIAEIVHQNERCFRPESEIVEKIETIYQTMLDGVYRGCHTTGILPGGLRVKRRAQQLNQQLLGTADYSDKESWLQTIRQQAQDFTAVNKWVTCFALAVNEENAALGRVVTSPTNGAAGVIPAVLLYYTCFCESLQPKTLRDFFYTSGEIGCLFKKGATISAAVGGCQAEIGVSSAMAAGGLTALLGGTPAQVLMAAEIAMEHHLGLTCDPIGGLVQIPCIERNAMGAMKAITASNLALSSDPKDAIVNFDVCVKSMWDTAQEMNSKYKETAEGGLAFNLPVVLPEC